MAYLPRCGCAYHLRRDHTLAPRRSGLSSGQEMSVLFMNKQTGFRSNTQHWTIYADERQIPESA